MSAMDVVRDLAQRKERGAFFTPDLIAQFLASWAIKSKPDAKVLDPTCGEAVFLLSAASSLRSLGAVGNLRDQLFGVDLHGQSLKNAAHLLAGEHRASATLLEADFATLETQGQLGHSLPLMDAVIGNPPFVRYQEHRGDERRRAAAAALAQGVRLSGLASSWAALLVHAASFLKDDGRLAMVLPAELLTVHYAEPVRRWLRKRFGAVRLVFFDHLQFAGAEEQVVLLAAEGSGGCSSFTLMEVGGAEDLANLHALDPFAAVPADEGKWTDLLLSPSQRQLFQTASAESFVALAGYGKPELGTVTGANSFFTLSEATRQEYQIPEKYLQRISPPGTKHLKSSTFTRGDWEELRCLGERVWLLQADRLKDGRPPAALRKYLSFGEKSKVNEAYKCTVRQDWWKPPAVTPPDLFFTYMSHRFPRIITNSASVGFLNSMHGVRLVPEAPAFIKDALPLLALNSLTLLGAEIFGRAYGGGILKMEPREAASLPVPGLDAAKAAWSKIDFQRTSLDQMLVRGKWEKAVEIIDRIVLEEVLNMERSDVQMIRASGQTLRSRRTREAK
jgi:adenine-specific DNA-methyltransferase